MGTAPASPQTPRPHPSAERSLEAKAGPHLAAALHQSALATRFLSLLTQLALSPDPRSSLSQLTLSACSLTSPSQLTLSPRPVSLRSQHAPSLRSLGSVLG